MNWRQNRYYHIFMLFYHGTFYLFNHFRCCLFRFSVWFNVNLNTIEYNRPNTSFLLWSIMCVILLYLYLLQVTYRILNHSTFKRIFHENENRLTTIHYVGHIIIFIFSCFIFSVSFFQFYESNDYFANVWTLTILSNPLWSISFFYSSILSIFYISIVRFYYDHRCVVFHFDLLLLLFDIDILKTMTLQRIACLLLLLLSSATKSKCV